MIEGLELADSYVFNPHKWMFTNFDCSLYYVKDKNALIKTFEILPEYLKTNVSSDVNNYRDWGIQLGRRFRALKLWFVLRSYGLESIRSVLRMHISLAQEFAEKIKKDKRFELLAPVPLNLICFRYKPEGNFPSEKINELNEKLKNKINNTGKAYITHTKLQGKYILRMCIGQTNVEKKHIDHFWELMTEQISDLE
jgi:aromatic-L-amino-acid/L-tryptophan decarboxylase